MYSFHLGCFFSSNEYLNIYHTGVYQINAFEFDKYKKSFHDLEKDDSIDAYVLADFARVGRTKGLYPFKGTQYIALQHKRALVLSARKLERLIFGLLRKNQYYISMNSVHNSKN